MMSRIDSMNAFRDPVSRIHGDMRACASCPGMLISMANDTKKTLPVSTRREGFDNLVGVQLDAVQ